MMESIKEKIMSVSMFRKILIPLKDRYVRKVSQLFPRYTSKKTYRKIFGKELDLREPKTLNEKLMYVKHNVYWDHPLVTQCADKYKVREFVQSNGCGETLNELLGVWEDAYKIDWSNLPDKFAIKCNHGSGYNMICVDKAKFDIESATKKLDQWMKETYGYGSVCEQGIYRNIKPMIIAEKFIETKDGLPPKDYKFFCSYGKCKFLFVASERVNNRTKFDFYWPDWTWIPVENCHPTAGSIPKPESLEKMIAYAEKLSEKFPIVRVDFYEESGEIIFGELTFTHFGCIHGFEPDVYDYEFGQCFPNANNLKLNI